MFVVSNALRLKLFQPYKKKEEKKEIEKEKGDSTMKKTMTIEGMACQHCAGRVRDALLKIDGVVEVTIDLDAKKADLMLSKSVDDAALKSAVEDAGYTVCAID